MAMKMACRVAILACSLFFSPILLDTIADAAIDNPIAIEYTINITLSVRPTVAIEFSPNLLTKIMSIIANRPSPIISMITGIESMKIALLMLPDVYSLSPAVRDLKKVLKNFSIGDFDSDINKWDVV